MHRLTISRKSSLGSREDSLTIFCAIDQAPTRRRRCQFLAHYFYPN